jgi:uncharacterized membrane protein YfcA
MMDLRWAAALAASGFLASLATNLVGIGGGLLVMPLLALAFNAREAVVLAAPMFLVNAVGTFWYHWRDIEGSRPWILLPGTLVGILAAGHLLRTESYGDLRLVIGGVALAFVGLQGYSLWTARAIRGLPKWVGVPLGLAAGGVSTLSNIGGTLASLYLLDRDQKPAAFIGGVSLFYVVSSVVKVSYFMAAGLLPPARLLLVVPAVPAVLAGAWLGTRFNRRVPSRVFAVVVLGVITLASGLLFVKA